MKKIIHLFVILLTCTAGAQDCKKFLFLQTNKTIEMTVYNRKGNENGKQVYTIADVKNSGTTVTSTVNSETLDKNGKSIARTSNQIQCTGGTILMDMKMFVPSQQMEQLKNTEATATGSFLEYPVSMKVGDKLKDGQFNMNIENNGVATKMDMSMTDRFVEGREKVTTTAGSWDAFKIIYSSKMRMKVAGIGIPVNAEVSEWYVPEFGVVKTESKYGSTLITSIR